MLRILLASALLALPCFAQSPAPLLADPPSRITISLDGTWNTIVDPYESGLGSHYYEKEKPKSKSDLVEFDFDHSPKLKVPGDWNTQRDSLLFYEGPVWYQRNFTYQRKPHTRTFLYFGAANYFSRAWLNGTKLGEHTGGFTPFDFEVTDQLTDGENSVVVEVDNTRRLEGVPSLKTDWWNYGGLTRSVKLIEVPKTFIENYSVQLAKGHTDEIEISFELNVAHLLDDLGKNTAVIPTVDIPELAVKQSCGERQNDLRPRSCTLRATPELWSPERPKLYQVLITAGDDHIVDYIGFRTIETHGTQILLNGKPIFLRGIAMHEEAPFRSGRAFSEEDDRTLLSWAKELGCNFVRMAHYPHNEDMVRLADHMGLLLWEEVPVYWDIQWQNPATLENAKAQLREEIMRDHNRASVVLWSMSNETPISPERTEFLKQLAADARQLDSTRLITSALNRVDRTGPFMRTLSDPFSQYLDVIGLNEYIGWYEGKPEDADQTRWTFAFPKPVIISEFGADALFNLHGDAQTRFTEEYQANVFEHQLNMLSHMPQLAGMSPWVLMDFRSPRRPLTGIQDYFNRKGLISDRGQRKQAFYILQKFYAQKAGQ